MQQVATGAAAVAKRSTRKENQKDRPAWRPYWRLTACLLLVDFRVTATARANSSPKPATNVVCGAMPVN
eukprot:3448293-Pleurochrysis_carterae.AAC.4